MADLDAELALFQAEISALPEAPNEADDAPALAPPTAPPPVAAKPALPPPTSPPPVPARPAAAAAPPHRTVHASITAKPVAGHAAAASAPSQPSALPHSPSPAGGAPPGTSHGAVMRPGAGILPPPIGGPPVMSSPPQAAAPAMGAAHPAMAGVPQPGVAFGAPPTNMPPIPPPPMPVAMGMGYSAGPSAVVAPPVMQAGGGMPMQQPSAPGPSGTLAAFKQQQQTQGTAHSGQQGTSTKDGGDGKKKGLVMQAAGKRWRDPTLDEWPENDFRIFVGDMGNEVTDDMLARAFMKYSSFAKAKIVRDQRTKKSKGFGFVSFMDSAEYAQALREMNGKYIGNRPCKLSKSSWTDRKVEFKKGKKPKK